MSDQSVSLREYLTAVMDERDRRYEDRFRGQDDAVKAALAAQKELTNAAFASSEKAITKAEDAQTSYNERTNELRGAMADQAKDMLTRKEADIRDSGWKQQIEELKVQVAGLRESRSAATGQKTGSQDVTARGMAAILAMAAIVEAVALIFHQKP